MLQTIKNILNIIQKKWKLIFIMIGFAAIYFPWFITLENRIISPRRYTWIHMRLDDYIPFCEYFIIPYFIWFAYVALTLVVCLFTDEKEYLHNCAFLYTGMTIFLIVSTVFPNAHRLRPQEFADPNFFTGLVSHLYSIDTSTNLFPSIHVYNSIGAHLAITHNEVLKDKKWLRYGSFIICVSIIMSTVFLKQHSVFDMLTAFAMAFVLYPLVYKVDYAALRERRRVRRRIREQESHI